MTPLKIMAHNGLKPLCLSLNCASFECDMIRIIHLVANESSICNSLDFTKGFPVKHLKYITQSILRLEKLQLKNALPCEYRHVIIILQYCFVVLCQYHINQYLITTVILRVKFKKSSRF